MPWKRSAGQTARATPRLGLWLLSLAATSVALGVVAPRACAEEPSCFFEYLYVEASAGDSSGGHAAICFADRCYHFQQDEGRVIRLHETDAAEFDYRYRLLGNRTIHASRVAVSTTTYDRLRSAFEARRRVQDRQYEVLDSLTQDRALLQQLLDRRDDPTALLQRGSIHLPGSAYFFADERDEAGLRVPATEPSVALDLLAARVRAAYGNDFLERRAASLRVDIAHLTPTAEDATFPAPAAGTLPLVPGGFATRHRELVSGWLALDALRAALPLRAGTFHAPEGADFALGPAEIEVLRAYAKQLTEALVRLPVSKRPDWGYPMLVGMARLVALEASTDSGHLIVLDDFPEDAAVVAPAIVSRHAATLALVRDEQRAEFLAARREAFDAQPPGEAHLSVLETAADLFIDIDRALDQGSPLRLFSGRIVPMKGAVREDWPLPEPSVAMLQRALMVALDRERAYRTGLEDLYPYDLIAHNCVTEIFRTMEAAVAEPHAPSNLAAVRDGSTARLGGYVDVGHTLNFIPFLSAKAVRTAYRVSEIVERPSYRRIALDQMYRHENPVRVDLRESNVFTAHSYARSQDDPIFLFFTDDVVLRRPLYGIANFAVGIGGTLVGLVLLPIDGSATLRAGLDGALFSVPEMVFVNIRKGSVAFAPRRWLGGDAGRSIAPPRSCAPPRRRS